MLNRRKFLVASAAVCAPFVIPSTPRAATRKLRIGHNNTVTSSLQAGAVAFQKYVTEKSEGRMDAEIFPLSQLGSEVAMAKGVADGTLDATVSPMAVLSSYHADLSVVEYPYMFSDVAAARKALDGKLGSYFGDILKKHSITAIGWGENGLRHMTANKPIRKPADLKGLKLRVQPAKLHIEAFRGLGATADALAFSELKEAMRTGRFEAQENPISVITASDFLMKLQSHISLTGHVYSPFAILFSSDVLEELKGPDREVVMGAGLAASAATRKFNEDLVATGLAQMKAAGMTVVEDVDVAEFQKAVSGMSKTLGDLVGQESLTRIRELVA